LVSLAVSPATGVAQDRNQSESPEELWRDYPLNPKGEADAGGAGSGRVGSRTEAGHAPPVAERPGSEARRPEPREDTGMPAIAIVLLVLLAVPLLALFVLLAPFDVRHLLPARRAGRGPPGRPFTTAPRSTSRTEAEPPWTAEIRWRRDAGTACFCVVASRRGGKDEATLATSPPVRWPPNGENDVQSLIGAVSILERSIRAAGWEPADRGASWFARRFVWPDPERPPELTLERAEAAKRA